jgi:hypothetical protein
VSVEAVRQLFLSYLVPRNFETTSPASHLPRALGSVAGGVDTGSEQIVSLISPPLVNRQYGANLEPFLPPARRDREPIARCT